MTGTVESKLAELGIVLPTPSAPVANYVGFVRTGRLLMVSGQICTDPDGKLVAKGKLGAGVSTDDGQKAARACAVNLLAQIKAALGDLDKVTRVVRLGGSISSSRCSATRGATPAPLSGSRCCRSMPPSRSRGCSRCNEAKGAMKRSWRRPTG